MRGRSNSAGSRRVRSSRRPSAGRRHAVPHARNPNPARKPGRRAAHASPSSVGGPDAAGVRVRRSTLPTLPGQATVHCHDRKARGDPTDSHPPRPSHYRAAPSPRPGSAGGHRGFLRAIPRLSALCPARRHTRTPVAARILRWPALRRRSALHPRRPAASPRPLGRENRTWLEASRWPLLGDLGK